MSTQKSLVLVDWPEMDRRIVAIVKAPSDNDMFFDNHNILIQGRIPGDNEV